MSADRTIVVPAPYVGMLDAELRVFSSDGERADMELLVPDAMAWRVIARGEGFRRPEIGPHTWLDCPDAEVAGVFGAFLSHALESGERDGWSILTDGAADWCDTLALMESDHR